MSFPLDNSDDMFNDAFSQKYSQQNNISEKNEINLNPDDDSYLLKEFLLNSDLRHNNLLRKLDFGISKTTYGPYECTIQFGARYFLSIIRDYYIKLNCDRINFIIMDKMIYIYSHMDSLIEIITKINTHYISHDKVKILEGFDKEFKANFNVLQLLKNLELHNFSQKENIKISFKIFKNVKNNKNRKSYNNENNPFFENIADIIQFEKEFNFEEEAIPGLLIVEANNFSFSMNCNFAPPELCDPPNIPEYIINKFIFYISVDKISNFIKKVNLQPIEIFCNKYICNFKLNTLSENFLFFKNEDGAEFIEENSFNYFKLFDPLIQNEALYKSMLAFTLSKQEIDALKILDKNSALFYFYADNKEKYYFTKETDEDRKITSAVFLKYKDNKSIIRNIEDCCLYEEHWEDWLEYLSSILPRDCINELRKLNENKGEKKLISNNKKSRNKKSRSEVRNENNNNNVNQNIQNINVIDGDNQFQGINLYINDKNNKVGSIQINENNNKRASIPELGRGKNYNNNNNQKPVNEEQNNNENLFNPFSYKI